MLSCSYFTLFSRFSWTSCSVDKAAAARWWLGTRPRWRLNEHGGGGGVGGKGGGGGHGEGGRGWSDVDDVVLLNTMPDIVYKES